MEKDGRIGRSVWQGVETMARKLKDAVLPAMFVVFLFVSTASSDVLDTKEVRLSVQGAALETVVDDLARQAGLQARIEASAAALRDKSVTLAVDEPLPLRTALDLVAAYAGLRWTARGGEIVVFKALPAAAAGAEFAKPAADIAVEWIAKTYDVHDLVYPVKSAQSPFRRHRVGSYYQTGGHPTYINSPWEDYVVAAGSREIVDYEYLYHGLNEEEYEHAILLNKARSLIYNIMHTVSPGTWAPPIIQEEVTELAAPDEAGIPPFEAVERAIAAGKTGIILYRDGIMTVITKKGVPATSKLLGADTDKRLSTQGGVGISVAVDRNSYLVISEVVADGPAALAGLRVGDIIVAVDERNIAGMTLDMVADAIRGPLGSKVVISVVRGPSPSVRRFELVRAPVKTPDRNP